MLAHKTNANKQNLSDEYEEGWGSLPIDQGRTTAKVYLNGEPSLQINSL